MQKQDFQFHLPESLIANEPCQNRTDSRLMCLDSLECSINGAYFHQIVDFLDPDDCLIFNNTKVIPARLYGHRGSGGKVEILVERILEENGKHECIAQLKASNKLSNGTVITIADDFALEVLSKVDSFYRLRAVTDNSLIKNVERYGAMPLPPYIKRTADEMDELRYQTVYAKKQGAVAAPTAGLHFDEQLMQKIKAKGVALDFVTLHVGAGTFSPMRVDNILDHEMHKEWFEVPQSVVDLIAKTQSKGGRVIAVGTTSVRCLESAATSGKLTATSGETDIFIYPGYEFKVVDGLITNFHLSESTLLMLVSAFAGKNFILQAYEQAVAESYRFFSYGDAMFIQNRQDSGNPKS